MLSTIKIGLVSGSALPLLTACGSTSSSVSENFEEKSFSVTYEQAIADFQKAYPAAAISSIDFDKDFAKYTFEISGFKDTQEIEWK